MFNLDMTNRNNIEGGKNIKPERSNSYQAEFTNFIAEFMVKEIIGAASSKLTDKQIQEIVKKEKWQTENIENMYDVFFTKARSNGIVKTPELVKAINEKADRLLDKYLDAKSAAKGKINNGDLMQFKALKKSIGMNPKMKDEFEVALNSFIAYSGRTMEEFMDAVHVDRKQRKAENALAKQKAMMKKEQVLTAVTAEEKHYNSFEVAIAHKKVHGLKNILLGYRRNVATV